MGLKFLIAITLLAAPLAACEQGNKADGGALVGAVAGGRSVSVGQINIPITAAPGMSARDVGREVSRELHKFFRELMPA